MSRHEACMRSPYNQIYSEEVLFRFHGNNLLDPVTEVLTIGAFYTYHSVPSKASILLNVPSTWKTLSASCKSAPLICLELYVDVLAFHGRSSAQFDESSYAASAIPRDVSQKRGRSTSTATHGPNATSKQSRTAQGRGGALVSTFARSRGTSAQVVRKTTQVSFDRITCNVDSKTGEVELVRVDTDVLTGALYDTEFGRGKMKVCYELSLGDEQYIAKRFYRVHAEDDDEGPTPNVSVKENATELYAELSRLSLGSYFLAIFLKYATQFPNIIDSNVVFTQAFVLEETQQVSSTASGLEELFLPDNTGNARANPGMSWLVEPKRASVVTKFSGTLTHGTSHLSSVQAKTVFAFAHFAYVYSKRTVAFADFQGTQALVKGRGQKAFNVLFDCMTHTTDLDSGLGDHGTEGIESFVRDHKCTDVCVHLRLDTDMPLEGPVGDSSDSP